MPTRTPASLPETIAAVDLGSNSFHMIVARPQDGELLVVDRLREMVRMAAGLDTRRNLAPDAAERALDCLARFGQRLKHMPPGSVRIVGTNTLRSARNATGFMAAAERAAGHPIEIISGVEEARLIYLGVSHALADDGKRRLVMDIGGGSTEFIIGERFEPIHMESTYMGCVSMSQAHFPNGEITAKGMRAAELAALVELEPHQSIFRQLGWEEAVGASGTIRAVERVVREQGWSDHGITLAALKKLCDAMLKAGHVNKLKLTGLGERRTPVFPGGVMVLLAAFEALGIDTMQASDGALREGLLYDLMGRIRHEDVRSRTVNNLETRYQVDRAQATRVESTVVDCLDMVNGDWDMDGEMAEQLLVWAARLHEIGLAIAHSQYQKHGAYILQNSDLQGFSRKEQCMLAALVRSHRRKFSLALFRDQPGCDDALMARMAVLLRLAALLHRSRSPAPLPEFSLKAVERGLHLKFPEGWLEQHPLTHTDLEQETAFLKAAEFTLSYQ